MGWDFDNNDEKLHAYVFKGHLQRWAATPTTEKPPVGPARDCPCLPQFHMHWHFLVGSAVNHTVWVMFWCKNLNLSHRSGRSRLVVAMLCAMSASDHLQTSKIKARGMKATQEQLLPHALQRGWTGRGVNKKPSWTAGDKERGSWNERVTFG